ncbi:unnamed protein product [Brassica oleracea]
MVTVLQPNVSIQGGSMYSLSSFDVSRFNQNFRLSVRFGELTEPEEFFRFHNHSELLGLANTILSFQTLARSQQSRVLSVTLREEPLNSITNPTHLYLSTHTTSGFQQE